MTGHQTAPKRRDAPTPRSAGGPTELVSPAEAIGRAQVIGSEPPPEVPAAPAPVAAGFDEPAGVNEPAGPRDTGGVAETAGLSEPSGLSEPAALNKPAILDEPTGSGEPAGEPADLLAPRGEPEARHAETPVGPVEVTAPIGAIPLLEPREGTPPPVDTPDALAEVADRLARGAGAVAVDAERASGYRYGQRAYLVQLRRLGAGTALIDPLPFDDLAAIDTAIADAEWVLHAASQDLPCLAELGMRPRRLFDTELAGRLAGFERVGLGAMVERVLGYTLEKGHSAADWSTRPLPRAWLTYAALDVELLVELRDALATELGSQGKLGWAEQEFAALAASRPATPRAEPWRRTSGIHRVRSARGLARVRALWEARDELAQRRDLAPGRVLPDSAIVAAAQADPADERALLGLPVFSGRATRRLASIWLAALYRARTLPDTELPSTAGGGDGPPPAHRWADRDPAAAARLARARQEMMAIAAEHNLPTENLLAPDSVRRLAWAPPDPLDLAAVTEALRSFGARDWQIELTAVALVEALDS